MLLLMRMVMLMVSGLAAAWVIAPARSAIAQPLNAPDALNPRALAMGETLRAAATGALATTLNPAGLVLVKNYVLEGAYGFRPDDSAHSQAVSLCDSVTTRVAACLYYNHLSSDFTLDGRGGRHRHEVGLTVAAPLADGLSVGVTNKYVSYGEDPPDAETLNQSHDGFIFEAGLLYRLSTVSAAFVAYNLFGGDEATLGRALGFGLAWNVTPEFLVAADGRYDLEKSSGRYGAGAEYLFTISDGAQGIPIRLGYVFDSLNDGSSITAGLGFISQRFAVDFGGRKQVSGGDELMMQLSVRLFFPSGS